MKKILITGCSTGFGYDAAKYLAKKGHDVYASMRNVDGKNAKAASSLLAFAEQYGLKIKVIDIDVTSDSSVNRATANLPVIDVLINNAGVGYGGPMESFSADEIIDQLDLNIVGTVRMAKAVLPGMRAQKSGLIIQVSSTAGRAAFPGFGVYHASKWGLEGMSEAMRYELAPLGIDLVLVEPGPFATDFFKNIVQSKDQQIATAYQHVNGFLEGFGSQVQNMYEDQNAPTDPMIVVKIFDDLINMQDGTRPLRTIAGLDFGYQALNDAIEPIRKAGLEGMGIRNWDGPQS
jgi:short-subunit dehydrogenase